MDKNLTTLLNICAVLGICLYTPAICGPKGKRIISLYILFLMGILALNTILGIMNSTMLKEFIISWSVATVVFISQMVTHFIILCEALSKQQQHEDFLNTLQEIDVYFRILLKMNVKKSKIIKKFRSTLIVLNIISKSCLIIFALTFSIFSDSGYFWWAFIAILAMRFRFIQLIVYVEILKHYLLALNLKLKQVVCLKTEQCKQLLDIDYKNLHSMEIIKNIKVIYASIYEASTLMNEFSQCSLFAACASNFLDFTCHIYWTLLVMENLLGLYNIISSFATIFPLGLFILKFCYTCQKIKEENHQTSLLLSRLITCNSLCLKANKHYKELIHDFSMQLMHQRIIFTGKRFFNFDLHCIFAICALIATHLIILIQFTKNDKNYYNNETHT